MKFFASKQEADTAYANADFIPDGMSYPDQWNAEAARFRDKLSGEERAHLDLAYGSGERHKFDLFFPGAEPKGVMVFIHGGYWLAFDKSTWSHFAEGAIARGWAVAMPSYDLCPAVGIPDITRQMTQAVTKIAETVPDLPIAITGHSAGGHLTARMVEPGRFPPTVEARISRAVPISPVGDLRPLLETTMNDNLGLTPETARVESPTLGQPRLNIPATIWVGGNERPVFLEQAAALGRVWDCPVEVPAGDHHFNVIDALCDPDSKMVNDLLG